MAQREPYPAVQIERGAGSGFGAGGPARRNAWPAGCKPFALALPHSVVPSAAGSVMLRPKRRGWQGTNRFLHWVLALPCWVKVFNRKKSQRTWQGTKNAKHSID